MASIPGSKETNPDLLSYRESSTVYNDTDNLELAYILAGGKQRFERCKTIAGRLSSMPQLTDDIHRSPFLSREESYERALGRAVTIYRLRGEMGMDEEDFRYVGMLINYDMVIALHWSNVLPAIRLLGTEEQQTRWIPPGERLEYLATYAQTELGHGTYLPRLETTATYDVATQEFVLHTPTLTAMKWWPGALGKTSTHALVQAQLYTQGICHGVHMFMVQLRSLRDHTPMPGVTLGDIGPKVSINSVDNGYLRFEHYRVPRQALLMRYHQVSPSGQYSARPGSDKAAYSAMLMMRVVLVAWAYENLAKAATIACRYSVVRRQTAHSRRGVEDQVIAYQTQQYKVFLPLATSYAFFFCTRRLTQLYHVLQQQGTSTTGVSLQELHALSAGLKALTSEQGVAGIESCRRACGGHGFSLSSGLPRLYSQLLIAVTAEGENTVMYLQTARFLLKQLTKMAHAGVEPTSVSANPLSSTDYLLPGQASTLQQSVTGDYPEQLTSHSHLLQLYTRRARGQLHHVAERLQRHLSAAGGDTQSAWSNSTVMLVDVAKAHCQLYIVRSFIDSIAELDCSSKCKNILVVLCTVYCLHNIVHRASDFMQFAGLTSKQLNMLKDKMLDLLEVIRPECIGLTDAFNYPDFTLNSTLGSYDGQVYRRLWEWVQNEPLNATQVHRSYDTILKPLLKREKARL